MAFGLRVVGENDRLVFDACCVKCAHETSFIWCFGAADLDAYRGVRHAAEPRDIEAACLQSFTELGVICGWFGLLAVVCDPYLEWRTFGIAPVFRTLP